MEHRPAKAPISMFPQGPPVWTSDGLSAGSLETSNSETSQMALKLYQGRSICSNRGESGWEPSMRHSVGYRSGGARIGSGSRCPASSGRWWSDRCWRALPSLSGSRTELDGRADSCLSVVARVGTAAFCSILFHLRKNPSTGFQVTALIFQGVQRARRDGRMAMRPYEMASAVILRGTVRLADISGLRACAELAEVTNGKERSVRRV